MSNGSERVRELPTPKPDYEALVKEARSWLLPGDQDTLEAEMADAVEALLAEAARAWEMGWLAGHRDCWDHECGQGHGRIVNPYSGSEACEGSAGA